VQIAQTVSLQIGFLVALHGDSVLESLIVTFVAIDGVPIIEVDVVFSDRNAAAGQLHMNASQIPLPSILGFKAKPDRPFLAIVAVEIAAVQPEMREVTRVEVGHVVQGVNAALFLRAAFPELQMKVRILASS
jgi:hypothetical protein